MVKFKQEENKHERLKYSVLQNIIAREHGRSYLTDHTRDS